MDFFIPSEPFLFGDGNLKPYLSWAEREAFMRADKRALHETLLASCPHSSKRSRFVVHIPFDEREHLFILQYLSVAQFLDLSIPLHNLPLQMQIVLPERTPNSVVKYIGDMVRRGSSSYDAEDKMLYVDPPYPPKFPMLGRGSFWNFYELLSSKATDGRKQLSSVIHISNLTFAFVPMNAPIIAVDVTNGGHINRILGEGDKFTVAKDSCCIYTGSRITFFDFLRPMKAVTPTRTTRTFASDSFDLDCSLNFVAGSPFESHLYAALCPSFILIKYNPAVRSVNQLRDPIEGIRLEWINHDLLAVYQDTGDVYLVNLSMNSISVVHWLEKPFDAYIFECNGPAVVYQMKDYELHVHPFGTDEFFTLKMNVAINECAYVAPCFACMSVTEKGTIISVWNLSLSFKPVERRINRGSCRLRPVAIPSRGPLFCFDNGKAFKFIDTEGNISESDAPKTGASVFYTYVTPDGEAALCVSKDGRVSLYRRKR